MSVSDAMDVKKQLAFYGSYHRNPVNIGIHIFGVPLILWTAMVFFNYVPVPEALPHIYHPINKYLAFEGNLTLLLAASYNLYYIILQPTGGLLYLPQMTLMYLSSVAFKHNQPNAVPIAIGIHVFCWIAQFIGHGVFEGRAPALFDSLQQALVLAPFFVHLEMLFPLGFSPELHKDVNNLSAMELTRVRKLEGEKRRAQELAKKRQ